MVQRLGHTTIYVLDQDKALDFYVNKLGFKVHTDAQIPNGGRWLTVVAPGAPDTELILADPGMSLAGEHEAAIRKILEDGKGSPGVLFTENCLATYKELKAKGVEFKGEPVEQFYGTEAIMYDGCGNWYSLTTPAHN